METVETRIDIVGQIKGKVVDTVRNWNNDRYEYMDSAILWNSDTMETESKWVGVDFWDGVSFESVKASDCVIALYKAIQDGRNEMRIRDELSRIASEAKGLGFERADQIEWFKFIPRNYREAVVKLFKANKLGDFKKSLRDQIGAWLVENPASRAYESPLSPRQWGCLVGNGPSNYRRWR